MRAEKEQTTIITSLRLPEQRNEYIKEKALEIGISQNAFTLILIDLGIKSYGAEITVLHQIKE